jgi:hypothetical protein
LKTSPLDSALRFVVNVVIGRIHFPKNRLGEIIILDDGLEWTIFRQVIITPSRGQPEIPGAIFRPRFRIKGMSHAQNVRFSILPIPFFVGLPGFRSKLWLYNEETGDSSGYYEWDSLEDAENYRNSFAARFMARRSEPGSVSFIVTPQK